VPISASEPLFSGPYAGNDVTTVFDYGFRVYDPAEVMVIRTSAAGAISVLAYPADYSVTGAGDDGGGTITLTGGALETGATLTLVPDIALSQERPFSTQSSTTLQQLEAALDKLTSIARQLQEQADRSLRLPAGSAAVADLPLPEAGQALVGNATGTGYENGPDITGIGDIPTLVSDAQAAAADAEASAAQTHLAPTKGSYIATGASAAFVLTGVYTYASSIDVYFGGDYVDPSFYTVTNNGVNTTVTFDEVTPAGVRVSYTALRQREIASLVQEPENITNPDSSTSLDVWRAVEPFADRDAFLAATITAHVDRVCWFDNDRLIKVVRDAAQTDGPIAQTDGTLWYPDGPVLPEHFADNTTPGATPMLPAANLAAAYSVLSNTAMRFLDRGYSFNGAMNVVAPTNTSIYFDIRGVKFKTIIYQEDNNADTFNIQKGFGNLADEGWAYGTLADLTIYYTDATYANTGKAINMTRCLFATVKDIFIDGPSYHVYLNGVALSSFTNIVCRGTRRNRNGTTPGVNQGVYENCKTVFTIANNGTENRCFNLEFYNPEHQAGGTADVGWDIRACDTIKVIGGHTNNAIRKVHIETDDDDEYTRNIYQVFFTSHYFDGNTTDYTITDETPIAGDGIQTAFVYAFTPEFETDIVVTLTQSAGPTTRQVLTADYTVDLATKTVTMGTPPPTGDTITLSLKQTPAEHVFISSSTSTGPTGTARIEGLYFTTCYFRVGTELFKLDPSSTGLDGLQSVHEVMFTGCEVQQISGRIVTLANSNYASPALADMIENFEFMGGVIEEGPTATLVTDRLAAFVLNGKNLKVQGVTISGGWTDAGEAVIQVQAQSENTVIANNIYDATRDTNDLVSVHASAVNTMIDGWKTVTFTPSLGFGSTLIEDAASIAGSYNFPPTGTARISGNVAVVTIDIDVAVLGTPASGSAYVLIPTADLKLSILDQTLSAARFTGFTGLNSNVFGTTSAATNKIFLKQLGAGATGNTAITEADVTTPDFTMTGTIFVEAV